ncbi:hypothetical protein PIB30_038414 [Stylosanthes scabra]|uniref:Uncharacterized protein n=1 Tax=Stylosanthes scabra TaxID=79078 RepID=A0ABU6VCH3_9FABA|nr:hypothetical protein [Stylosanthes scabra]
MLSDEETEAFVGFMEEVLVDGMKSDYGQFRPGIFEKLALKMIEKFSNCTLTPKHYVPSQSQGNGGQGTPSSANHGTLSKRFSGKKRKQTDIIERMADEVHESIEGQREDVKILVDSISQVNLKMSEKLEQLGFADHVAIYVSCVRTHDWRGNFGASLIP